MGLCPYAGKGTGKVSLLRRLWNLLREGDVLLADGLMCNWRNLYELQQRGVAVVTRLNKALRKSDFRKGTRLGPDDHLVQWPKPHIRDVGRAAQRAMPRFLTVREVRVRVKQAGFRTREVIVVTTLLDANKYSKEDLAGLYRARCLWTSRGEATLSTPAASVDDSSPSGCSAITQPRNIASGLHVGFEGNGTLRVEAGAEFVGRIVRLGEKLGSTGAATATGDSSLWRINGGVIIGTEGRGILRQTSRARVRTVLAHWSREFSPKSSLQADRGPGAGRRMRFSLEHRSRFRVARRGPAGGTAFRCADRERPAAIEEASKRNRHIPGGRFKSRSSSWGTLRGR